MKAEIREERDVALNGLMQICKTQGYLTIDDIFVYVEKMSLPIDEIDRLCDDVASAGVIVLNEAPHLVRVDESTVHHQYIDKTRLDYNQIFDRVVKIDNSLADYVERLRHILPPQRREESSLIQHAKEGNSFARERLITMYLKVALRIALQFHDQYNLPLDETIQEANVGLILALEKMPLDGNTRFSTYATWWIRQNIERRTQGLSRTFYNVPVHLKLKLLDVIKLKLNHRRFHYCNDEELHCSMLVESVYEKLSIDTATTLYYLYLLDETVNIGQISEQMAGDGTILDFIDDRLELEFLLSRLGEREQQVLALRYGLYDGHQRTLEEVGEQFGVTRERVRQIETKALKRMQQMTVS